MGKQKQGSRHKYTGRNQGPARRKYTQTNKLMEHKVKNLMRFNGLTRAEAEVLWTDTRKRSRQSKAPAVGGVVARTKKPKRNSQDD